MTIQNQFELSGAQEWTSRENADAFLQTIASETSAVLDVIGQSYEGRDLLRLTVGTGAKTILITGGVHGNEPASRETVLLKARDVAYDENNQYANYLSKYKIMFVPTVNPDKVLQTRFNAQNLNINRDTIFLQTPEARALLKVMADERPYIHADFHERAGSVNLDTIEFIRTMNYDPNSDLTVRARGNDMVSYIRSNLEGKGYSTSDYPVSGIGATMMTSGSGLLGSIEMVPETMHENPDKQFRINILSETFDLILNWHLENEIAVQKAKDDFYNNMIKPGDSFTLINGDYDYYSRATTLPISLPKGYLLDNREEFAKWEEVYNIQVNSDGFVPIQQPSGRLIPRLLDPLSEVAVTTATRVEPDNGRYTKVLYDVWREVFIKSYSGR